MIARIDRYLGAFVVSLGYGMLSPLAGELIEQTRSSVLVGLLIGIYPFAKAVGYAACIAPRARLWSARALLFLAAASYAAIGISFTPIAIGIARCFEGFVFGWFLGKASLDIATSGTAVGYRLSWLNGLSSAGVLIGPLLIAGADALGRPQAAFILVAALCAWVAVGQRGLGGAEGGHAKSGADLRWVGLSPVWALIATFALFDLTYGMLSLGVPIAFQPLESAAVSATAALFSAGFLIFAVLMPIFGRLADRFSPLPILIATLALIASLFVIPSVLTLPPAVIGGILLIEYVAASAAYSFALAILGALFPRAIPVVGILESLAMSAGSVLAGSLLVLNDASRIFGVLAVSYVMLVGLLLFCAKR